MTEKHHIASSWTLPPTARQCIAIARLCTELGIKDNLEDKVKTRWEARHLMHELRQKRKGGVSNG